MAAGASAAGNVSPWRTRRPGAARRNAVVRLDSLCRHRITEAPVPKNNEENASDMNVTRAIDSLIFGLVNGVAVRNAKGMSARYIT